MAYNLLSQFKSDKVPNFSVIKGHNRAKIPVSESKHIKSLPRRGNRQLLAAGNLAPRVQGHEPGRAAQLLETAHNPAGKEPPASGHQNPNRRAANHLEALNGERADQNHPPKIQHPSDNFAKIDKAGVALSGKRAVHRLLLRVADQSAGGGHRKREDHPGPRHRDRDGQELQGHRFGRVPPGHEG